VDWSNYLSYSVAAAAVLVTFFYSRAQTRIMRQGLKQSLEQNIGDDIAAALAQYLQQSDPSASAITPTDTKNSPVAIALRDYMRGYIGRRLSVLQDKSITPTFDALTQRITGIEQTVTQHGQTMQQVEQSVAGLIERVKHAEEGLHNTHVDIYNQILSDLSRTLATVSLNGHFIQALAEEARTIQTNIEEAEARITAQTSRYADDIGNHDRDLAALHAQLDEVRESINQKMAARVLHMIAEQLLRASQG